MEAIHCTPKANDTLSIGDSSTDEFVKEKKDNRMNKVMKNVSGIDDKNDYNQSFSFALNANDKNNNNNKNNKNNIDNNNIKQRSKYFVQHNDILIENGSRNSTKDCGMDSSSNDTNIIIEHKTTNKNQSNLNCLKILDHDEDNDNDDGLIGTDCNSRKKRKQNTLLNDTDVDNATCNSTTVDVTITNDSQLCANIISNQHKRKKHPKHRCPTMNSRKNSSLSHSMALVAMDDILAMDVTEYMKFVKQQANELPEIFVAPSSNATVKPQPPQHIPSFAFSTPLSSDQDVSQNSSLRLVQKSCSLSIESKNIHSSSSSHDNRSSRKKNNNSIKNKTNATNDYILTGCAGSALYLISHRTAVLPPPTMYHLPQQDQQILNEQEQQINKATSSSYVRKWVDETIANFVALRTLIESERMKNQALNTSILSMTPTTIALTQDRELVPTIKTTESLGTTDCLSPQVSQEPDDQMDTNNNNKTVCNDNENKLKNEKNVFYQRRTQPVPPLKDRMSWYTFCLGYRNRNDRSRDSNYNDSESNIENSRIGAAYHDSVDVAAVAFDEDDEHTNRNKNIDYDSDNDDCDGSVLHPKIPSKPITSLTQLNEQKHPNASPIPTNCSTETVAPLMTWQDHLPPNGYSPTMQLLLQMDQIMIRRILQHLSHYLVVHYETEIVLSHRNRLLNGIGTEKNNVDIDKNDSDRGTCCNNSNTQLCLWIYALLARLEQPIHRDDCVTLYTVLKQLTLLRSTLKLKFTTEDKDPKNDNMDMKEDENRMVSKGNGTCFQHNLSPSSKYEIGHGQQNELQLRLLEYNKHLIAEWNVLIAIIGIYFEQGGGYKAVMEVPVSSEL